MSVLTRFRTSTVATLNLFLILRLFGVYLKVALLGNQWYAVARFLGKYSPHELSPLERLGFFSGDIALNLLVVPLAATALLCLVAVRYRTALAVVMTVGLSLAYYIELRAQQEVGQYISREVFADLIGWGLGDPSLSADYVTPTSVLKLALLLGVLVTIGIVARLARAAKHEHRVEAVRLYRRLLQAPVVVLLPAAVVLATAGFAFRLPNSPLNESAVGRAFVELTATNHEAYASSFTTVEQALDATRQQTRTQALDAANPHIGRERGADLLIFMMETGPAEALELAHVGRTLPGTGPLYERAFVAARHYTTHPYSSDALYSILSGLYPQGRRRLLRGSDGPVNALMTAMVADVPVRRVYVPSLYNIELDDRMYTKFGAETVYVSDNQPSDPLRQVAERRADELMIALQASGRPFAPAAGRRLRRRLGADLQALERVKADMTEAVRAGQRYAFLFFPEIGHAPWQALHGEEPVLARGRALMLVQDAWLKELTDTIRALGRLERTVIAVTADHGIRTRAEDPSLPVGRLSDYMFRVPLLIYAPQTLKENVTIVTPTSHVDFAPTLVALFGNTGSASRMQGLPIWQRSRGDRLYLLASAYGGADGFVQDGMYYMRQAMSGAVYCNTELTFGDGHQLTPGDPIIKWVSDELTDATQLQHALVTRMIRAPRP